MPVLLPVLIALAAGIAVAVQTPTNAALGRATHSPLFASLISFSVGWLVVAALWLISDRTPPGALRSAPAWTWVGGAYGAFFVTAAAYAAPRLGLATLLTLTIASQLSAALLLDHFGLLGLARTPASPGRIAGVALVLTGALLVRRG